MKRGLAAAVLALALALAAPLARPAGEGDPTSGDLVLLPGPLAPLDESTPEATGWHLPGRNFRAGEGWWALACGPLGCALSATRLSVRPAMHDVYDGEPVPSQKLQWAPLPANGAQVLAVFKPIRSLAGRLPLRAGPVTTWLHAGLTSYPRGSRPGTMETPVPAGQGAPVLVLPRLVEGADGADPTIEIELRIGPQRQSLGRSGFGIEGPQVLRGPDYLRWAGDLDGDGRPDLLVRLPGSGAVDVALYLSSLAGPGELVGLAGRFQYADPASAGC